MRVLSSPASTIAMSAPHRAASNPPPDPGAPRARLVEVFASLQGEGARVGERQVFVRFAVCDKKCAYCDTPESIGAAPEFARFVPGPGVAPEPLANPVEGAALEDLVQRLHPGPRPPVVSLTGGEPLLQAAFLQAWLPPLAERGWRFVLETHGLRAPALAPLLPWLEEVVMDVKVPSATLEPPAWEAHAAFLAALAQGGPRVTMKAVVSAATRPDELAEVLTLFEAAPEGSNRVLQPLHPFPGAPPPPSFEQLMAWQQAGLERGLDVRVVPQVHRLMGVA